MSSLTPIVISDSEDDFISDQHPSLKRKLRPLRRTHAILQISNFSHKKVRHRKLFCLMYYVLVGFSAIVNGQSVLFRSTQPSSPDIPPLKQSRTSTEVLCPPLKYEFFPEFDSLHHSPRSPSSQSTIWSSYDAAQKSPTTSDSSEPHSAEPCSPLEPRCSSVQPLWTSLPSPTRPLIETCVDGMWEFRLLSDRYRRPSSSSCEEDDDVKDDLLENDAKLIFTYPN